MVTHGSIQWSVMVPNPICTMYDDVGTMCDGCQQWYQLAMVPYMTGVHGNVTIQDIIVLFGRKVSLLVTLPRRTGTICDLLVPFMVRYHI